MADSRIRHAIPADLPAIVAIYNAAIPGRMATADTEPVTVAQREEWFRAYDPQTRPLWILEANGAPAGWLGAGLALGLPFLTNGRLAYHRTVESAVYVAPERQRLGFAPASSPTRSPSAPAWGSRRCSRSFSPTTCPA